MICTENTMLLQRLSSAGCARALQRQSLYIAKLSCYASRRSPSVHTRAAAAAAPVATQSSTSTPASSTASEPAAAPAPAYKVPLDFKFIRDNVQLITDNCRLRNSSADPALVAQLYEDFLALKAESEALRASRNENSAAMKVGGWCQWQKGSCEGAWEPFSRCALGCGLVG